MKQSQSAIGVIKLAVNVGIEIKPTFSSRTKQHLRRNEQKALGESDLSHRLKLVVRVFLAMMKHQLYRNKPLCINPVFQSYT